MTSVSAAQIKFLSGKSNHLVLSVSSGWDIGLRYSKGFAVKSQDHLAKGNEPRGTDSKSATHPLLML